MNGRRIALTAGVTAGHVNLALAVAARFREVAPDSELLFIGCGHGPEARLVPRAGIPFAAVSAGAIAGAGSLGRVAAVGRLALGALQAREALRRARSQMVLGFGGYASAPALLAGRSLGLTVAVHEANAVPGLTNRVLGRLAQRIYLGYREGMGRAGIRKGLHTGNPVRPEIAALLTGGDARPAPACPARVLVTGGSRGSPFLNTLAPALLGRVAALGLAVEVVHQVGDGDVEAVRASYAEHGLAARVDAYIDDMAAVYRCTDFALGCAGAVTLAELACAGLPALLVPLRQAADDHQRANAIAFAQGGAGWWVAEHDFQPAALAPRVVRLLGDAHAWSAARRAARALARAGAAAALVDDCQRLLASG